MKRYVITLLMCLAYVFTIQAQDETTFYVYRNDGQFNAFFCEEVDSISYSTIDCDSIEQDHVVVQEIWTQDSIYRVPLAVIDSVSFVKPETKYAENVVRMDERYLPYIISVDSLLITFSPDLPAELMPIKGNILLYEQFDDIFPEGFVGKVRTVDERIVVMCDSIGYEDVYEEIAFLGDFILSEDTNTTRKFRLVPRKIAQEIPLTFNINFRHNFENNISVEVEGSIGFRVRLVLRLQRNNPPYFEIQFSDEEKLSLKGSVGAGVIDSSIRRGAPFFRGEVPIPMIPALHVQFYLDFFSQRALEGELSAEMSFTSKGKNTFVFDNELRAGSNSRENTFNIVEFKGKISGFVWQGIGEQLGLTTVGHFLTGGLYTRVGPKISGELDLNLSEGIANHSWYDAMKDSKFEAFVRLESDIELEFRLGPRVIGNWPLFTIIPGIERKVWESYLFPEFTKPECFISNKKVDVESEVSRDVLLPCYVGYRLFCDNNEVDNYYNPTLYLVDDGLNGPLRATFANLRTGKYRVCPMIRMTAFNFDIEASPETTFYYGIEVVTGISTSSYANSHCKGYVKLSDEDGNPIPVVPNEYGFFYNTLGDPHSGTADKVACPIGQNGLFEGTLENLSDNTTYYYTAFARIGEDYFYGETKTFTTKKFPVKIISFEVTDALHDEGGYEFGGRHYEYKFECTTTVQIDDMTGVEDWGYAYRDPQGHDSYISLNGHESLYSDPWHVYYRETPKSMATLFGYVKFVNDGEIFIDNPKDYDLVYGSESCSDENHPHLVDLGLPSGLRWNCTNLGADVPEGYGGYYAYAELSEKNNYIEQNYLYYYWDMMFDDQYSYYTTIGEGIQNFGISISGKKGFDAVLEQYDDGRRMPTREELQELVDQCTWAWSFRNEVPGYEVTGPNGNSIFLPASGAKAQGTSYAGEPNRLTYYRSGEWSDQQWGTKGYGWTWGLKFKESSYEVVKTCAKAFGYAIRPVKSSMQ